MQVATMALGANLTIMVHPSAYVVHRPHNLTTIRNMWCSAINSRNTPEKAQAAADLAGELHASGLQKCMGLSQQQLLLEGTAISTATRYASAWATGLTTSTTSCCATGHANLCGCKPHTDCCA
jgi:hypothetical protein